MSITLVTTTRNRALCFSLLEKWVAQQTLGYDQWIVVNDGTEAYNYTMGQQVITRSPANDTLPSICENWLAAIPHVKGDRVIVLEDDDYYDARHFATLDRLLDSCDLGGISHDVYYKLPTRRFVRMHNDAHASLAATGFRAELLPQVERTARVFKSVWLDMYLWVECGTVWPGLKKLLPQPLSDGRMLHVGFKNMPGEAGLGMGHAAPMCGSTDPCFSVLREWIGPAVATYRKVWEDHCR